MKKTTFALIEQYMQACMKDSAHDQEHVWRVLNNALEIAKEEPSVNWDVLIVAALLHDISRAEQLADPKVDHALHGADKAHTFLTSQGFPADLCEHVCQCIRTHRFRKTEPPASLEAQILFDADKLDVAGAIGIARTLAYNGTTGRPIYTRDEDGHVLDGMKDAADSFFREYKFKLEHICDHFLTKRGQALALQRHAAAIAYYEALLQEVCSDAGLAMLNTLVTEE